MIETITISIVAFASKLAIVAEAIQSVAGSFTVIVASLGAVCLSASGALAWLSTVLPVPNKKGIYKSFHKYINIFGGNVGNAANALSKITNKEEETWDTYKR
jgi:hypothetical protein